ncbi:hypothetical protein J2754_002719 [Halarchaeum solikamskense]|nr:hypothetical protein [Halarchaeum solikamskense]
MSTDTVSWFESSLDAVADLEHVPGFIFSLPELIAEIT